MPRKKIIFFIYNSFKDPLFQSALYEYLLDNASTKKYKFLLLSYEQNDFFIPEIEKNNIKSFLKEKDIKWVDLKWHSGSFKIIKKGFDLLIAFLLLAYYRTLGFNKIISFGTLAGTISHINSRLLLLDHCVYQYEPHSEFLRDCNVWNQQSLAFRILNYFEKKMAYSAKILATGTNYMLDRLKSWKSPAMTFWVPSAVNDKIFKLDIAKRNDIRKDLGFENKKVIIYVGKFGEFYFSLDEVIGVLKQFYLSDPENIRFIVLSPQDQQMIRKEFEKKEIPANCFFVTKVPYIDVRHYLSAADFGIVAIPSKPSQKYRSPIKIGEYLCCGLPYLVCEGISEDDLLAMEENVGVVVKDFSNEEIQKAIPKAMKLMEEDSTQLYERCRQAGIKYRGLSRFKNTMREILEKL
jgi:hypothetical protein